MEKVPVHFLFDLFQQGTVPLLVVVKVVEMKVEMIVEMIMEMARRVRWIILLNQWHYLVVF